MGVYVTCECGTVVVHVLLIHGPVVLVYRQLIGPEMCALHNSVSLTRNDCYIQLQFLGV